MTWKKNGKMIIWDIYCLIILQSLNKSNLIKGKTCNTHSRSQTVLAFLSFAFQVILVFQVLENNHDQSGQTHALNHKKLLFSILLGEGSLRGNRFTESGFSLLEGGFSLKTLVVMDVYKTETIH